MTKHNRSLAQYLETPEPGGLAGLLQQLVYLQTLAPLLTKTLPETLASHCQLANYRQGRLIIAVSNQAIATRLRFILPDLRQQLRKHQAFAGLVGIDFYITKPSPGVQSLSVAVSHERKAPTINTSTPTGEIITDADLRKRWKQLLRHASED